MKGVSNASPLINLARIGQLALLPRIFGHLFIPDAVWQEVVVDGRGQRGYITALQPFLIDLRDVAGFHISSLLWKRALQDAEES